MSDARLTGSLVSVSWIHPASEITVGDRRFVLPVTDTFHPAPHVPRARLLTSGSFRFANVLDVYADPESDTCGFLESSGLVTTTSFASIPPETFKTLRRGYRLDDALGWHFYQLVGARTQSGERIGELAGDAACAFMRVPVPYVCARVGREVAEEVAFPPIWCGLSLDLRPDGDTPTRVVHHSLFPDLSVYVLDLETDLYRLVHRYHGVPHLEMWLREGWGTGNPWRIEDPGGWGGAKREPWQTG